MRKARVQQTAEAKATLARDINLVRETPPETEAERAQAAEPQRERQQEPQKERRREKLKIPVERARQRMVE